jgi:hypothetical protein
MFLEVASVIPCKGAEKVGFKLPDELKSNSKTISE